MFSGLLGFARLRTGDHYEVIIRYGTQKWKMKGSVKSSFDQTWGNTTKTLQPLLNDLIHIRVSIIKYAIFANNCWVNIQLLLLTSGKYNTHC